MYLKRVVLISFDICVTHETTTKIKTVNTSITAKVFVGPLNIFLLDYKTDSNHLFYSFDIFSIQYHVEHKIEVWAFCWCTEEVCWASQCLPGLCSCHQMVLMQKLPSMPCVSLVRTEVIRKEGLLIQRYLSCPNTRGPQMTGHDTRSR